jgi:hypothetical protein
MPYRRELSMEKTDPHSGANWQLPASESTDYAYLPDHTILDEPDEVLDGVWRDVLESYKEEEQRLPVQQEMIRQRFIDFYFNHGLFDRLTPEELEEAVLRTKY